MIILKQGDRYAVPYEVYGELQEKNLKNIKYEGKKIDDLKKVDAYFPEVIFANVYRKLSDGSIEVIFDFQVSNKITVKSSYKTAIFDKHGYFIASNTVSENEVVQDFNFNLDIEKAGSYYVKAQKGGVING